MTKKTLPVISLFSGALGLDLGLEQAGFQLRVAVEYNKFAAKTIRANRPDVLVIERKIENVSTEEILEAAGLEPGEPMVVTGGPSCQAFSTAGQRGSLNDPKGVMFREFIRVVRESRPRFFIMENVRGMLSAAIRHRPLKERGPGFPPLSQDEELGSAFVAIIKELKTLDYYVVFDLFNAADYGVPQQRERLLFLGSRDGDLIALPEPTHTKKPINGKPSWVTFRQGLKGLRDPKPNCCDLSASQKKYLRMIPPGGNWRDLLPEIQPEALGGAYKSWGGRSGFLRRLAWDKPSPALTTSPVGKATMLCHPEDLRPLSIKEYARLQQFPDSWQFAGGPAQQYTQIGNAVPVGLGKAVGEAIREAMRGHKKVGKKGAVVCPNKNLLERLSKRPSTMLNPARMRKIKNTDATREWMDACPGHRAQILIHID